MRKQIENFYQDHGVGIISRRGNQTQGQCPRCDSNGNGHFYFNDEGLYNCQKCGIKGNAVTYLKELRGITDGKQIHNILNKYELENGKYQPKAKKKIVEVYPYVNLQDEVIHETVRYEPKDFRQRRPDSKDGYIWNLKGVETILYRLPEIVKADTVVICEGEKDANNVIKHFGIQATTCPMGAGKWKPNYNKYLKGKTVFIVYDRDTDSKGYSHAIGVANSLLDVARSVKIVELPKTLNGQKIKDISDYIEAGGTKDEFLELVKNTEKHKEKIEISKTAPVEPEKEKKVTQAEKLIELTEDFELFHDQNEGAFVFYNNEALPLRSKKIKNLLSHLMYEETGKTPNNEALEQALKTLEGKAIFKCGQHELHNRVARIGDAFYYDLLRGEAIEIRPGGWEITKAPILFRRYSHQQPQVAPVGGGDVYKIFDFLNIEDGNKLLVLTSIISCFVPNIPHPILHPHGAQGSGKTTLCKAVKRLVDPSLIEALITPKDAAQLIQVIAHHHVCLFDNLSGLPAWMSDILAMACTGGGFSKRQLFTDDEDVIYQVKRCIGLNGINLLISKPDLMDRSVLLHLERILPAMRKKERDLWKKFEDARPYIGV